jgi:hypothetical protein
MIRNHASNNNHIPEKKPRQLPSSIFQTI